MSFKLSGLNGLPYLGVQATQPPQLLYVNRAPTVNDFININVGTLWLFVGQPNNSPIELYMAATVIPHNAEWILLFPSSGSGVGEFVTDAGSAIPAGGIINFPGGTNTNTSAAGNTMRVNLNPNVDLAGNLTVRGAAFFPGSPLGVLEITDTVTGTVTVQNGTSGQVLIAGNGTYPRFATISSSDNSITFTPGVNTLDMKAAFAPGTIIQTTFTNSGTWTPNVNTKYATIYAWSGGNGGGSGRRGTLDASSGGGGGMGGNGLQVSIPGVYLNNSAPVTVTIGNGGAGGAAVTVDNTNGNPGIIGQPTTVGYFTVPGGQFSQGTPGFTAGWGGGTIVWTDNVNSKTPALGTNGGYTGTGIISGSAWNYAGVNTAIISGEATMGGLGTTYPILDLSGISVNNSAFVDSLFFQISPGLFNGGVAINNPYFPFPSGGGGGSGAATVPYSGGDGGYLGVYPSTFYTTPAPGGIQGGTINGANGINYLTAATESGYGILAGGMGGGGGGGNSAGPGGNGGIGGVPGGGGGGGGGSVNGNNSGAGGAGGKGLVIIYEYL